MDVRAIASDQEDPLFHGEYAEGYSFLLKVCPEHLVCARVVAGAIAELPALPDHRPYQAIEVGCGSGLSTHLFLSARDDLVIQGFDLAQPMLDQAKDHLKHDIHSGRLILNQADAYSFMKGAASDSVDLVVSNYAIHNFLEGYRQDFIPEVIRVLRPGGYFINGDRYGVDDPAQHLAMLQEEVRGYFRVFQEMNRPDLLEAWVLHIMGDESLDRVMRLAPSLELMSRSGFESAEILYRQGINTVLRARKPA